MSSFIIISAGVIFTLAGDIFLKKSQMTNYWFFGLGLLLYAAGVIPVAIAFKRIDFGSVFLIWEVATVVLALIFASLYFKEPFTTYKGLALLFAVCALYFSYK